MSTRVEVVTAWWNEALLAPFFLKHYEYADCIHILYDEDTNDGTLKLLRGKSNIVIHPIKYADGIDWEVKSNTINELANSLKCDWVIAVDADEFIWPIDNMHDVKGWLSKQYGNIIHAAMFTVYRHASDSDLDYENPSVYQRRHGDFQIGVSYGQAGYIKPCIVKPEVQAKWSCGIHDCISGNDIRPSGQPMIGAHWCMADPAIAISRRLGQKMRQSQNNKDKNHGFQNFEVTEKEIRDECERHRFDPELF